MPESTEQLKGVVRRPHWHVAAAGKRGGQCRQPVGSSGNYSHNRAAPAVSTAFTPEPIRWMLLAAAANVSRRVAPNGICFLLTDDVETPH
jgi:hypothetical protein